MKHTTDIVILKHAYTKMQIILEQEWQGRAENLPITTPYQAVCLASIIEKETAAPLERAQIAGVFSRRLQQNMMLQTDPTVIYGMGETYQGNIKTADLKNQRLIIPILSKDCRQHRLQWQDVKPFTRHCILT